MSINYKNLSNFMKTFKILLLLSISLSSFVSMGQDVIVKNDKSEIKGKVLELTDSEIKYKKKEMPDGPIYSIKKQDVFMIIYQNGIKEYIEIAPVTSKTYETNVAGNNIPQTKTTASQNYFTTVSSNNSTAKKTAQNTSSNNKNRKGYVIFASDSYFKTFDVSYLMKISGDVFLGISWLPTLIHEDNTPAIQAIYPYLSYKLPVNENFNIWSTAGYYYVSLSAYTISIPGLKSVYVPSSSAGAFSWQVGSDYFFGESKKYGITGYTFEGQSYFFGLIYRE